MMMMILEATYWLQCHLLTGSGLLPSVQMTGQITVFVDLVLVIIAHRVGKSLIYVALLK